MNAILTVLVLLVAAGCGLLLLVGVVVVALWLDYLARCTRAGVQRALPVWRRRLAHLVPPAERGQVHRDGGWMEGVEA